MNTKGGENIKKINSQKTKEILGGASTSGAMLNGVAAIIGKATDFLLDIAALPLVYIESSKNHDKGKFKLGSTSIEFDNTTSIKNPTLVSNYTNEVIEVPTLESNYNSYEEQNYSINDQEERIASNSEFDESINYFG